MRKKNRRINTRVVIEEMKEYQRNCWKRNRFCECGADRFEECECPYDKKKAYIKRLNRKTCDKFEDKVKRINRGIRSSIS